MSLNKGNYEIVPEYNFYILLVDFLMHITLQMRFDA